MSILDSIILGIVQGLTEFLPVSSSGHLAIAKDLLNFEEPAITFDIFLHTATLLAVVIFFWQRIAILIKAFFGFFLMRYRLCYNDNKRFLWAVVASSIPTALIGLTLDKVLYQYFIATELVGYSLIITSLLLIISDNFKGRENVNIKSGFIVGVMQGIAVIPGISRSGSTISVALMLGIKREEAAEFSFIMSIPAILGATILHARHINEIPADALLTYGAGMVAAFISGIIAIKFVINIVKRSKMKIFAIYCLTLGILTVIFL